MKIIGSSLFEFKQLDSTNDYALKLIHEGISLTEGTLIFTKNQVAGRGQRGSVWQGKAGENLTFSLVLRPKHLSATKQFILSKVISLALYDYLVHCNVENVSIKWPNDVFVGNKKIAGMLIENTVKGELIDYSIIGIGLNLNEDFSAQNEFSATSLNAETKLKIYDVKEELLNLTAFIQARYLQFIQGKDTNIHSDYLKHLYKFNVDAEYMIDNKNVMASIIGVTENGKLQLKIEDGTIIECDLKEIKFLN